jgi:cell division septation protein DedD
MIYDRFRGDTEKSLFYLIIDDAHELDTTVLTKLKYLSTFNHDEFFPIIMIFVGHPLFLQDLKTPALSSLNQRIKRRCHLARFSLEDTKNYIYFRMIKSGATGVPAFPDETIRKIFEYSGGVPRLINNICDTCLLISASKHLISVPPDIVELAKILVEGSMTEAKAAARTDAMVNEAETSVCSKDKGSPMITFSEDLPAGPSIQQTSIEPTTVAAAIEYQPEITRPQDSLLGRKIKRIAMWALLIIVLVLAASWVYDFFVNNSDLLNGFLSTPSSSQNAPAPPEKTAVGIPTKNPAVEIPTLREEMTERPSGETRAPRDQTETKMTAPTDTSPKQTSNMEKPLPSKTEPGSAGTHEPFPLHPFSLRASSYQQQERALSEMSEIRQLGLTPYLVKADLGDLGTLWRIYIGIYSTEEEAKQAKAGYKLVNATVQRTDYACQVGEFSKLTDGMNLFERLKQSGYFPYAIQKGRNLFRMYLGAYEKRSEAEALQQELQKKGFKDQIVKR